MGKTKETHVGLLLDKTGSMRPVRDKTISGVNAYVETIKGGKNILFTLVTFNSFDRFDVVYDSIPPASAAELTKEEYSPSDATPLYDSIAAIIKHMNEQRKKAKRAGVKPKVLIVIMTDGQENDSREFTRQNIFDLIKKKKDKGWEFSFLGADQDAFVAAGAMGIPTGSTVTYVKGTEVGTLSAVAAATVSYSAGETRSGELFADVDADGWKKRSDK